MKPEMTPAEANILLMEKKKRFSQKRAQTLAFIGVSSDAEQNKPQNMCASNSSTANVGNKGHEDVTGFDAVDPKKALGMTTDQWREHKRNALFENYGDDY